MQVADWMVHMICFLHRHPPQSYNNGFCFIRHKPTWIEGIERRQQQQMFRSWKGDDQALTDLAGKTKQSKTRLKSQTLHQQWESQDSTPSVHTVPTCPRIPGRKSWTTEARLTSLGKLGLEALPTPDWLTSWPYRSRQGSPLENWGPTGRGWEQQTKAEK